MDVEGTLRFEKTTQIFSMQKQQKILKDLNKELGSSSEPEVPSTDAAFPDVPPSSATVTDSEMRSLPVTERPFPRRFGRIR
ncbi:hypothetical protein TNIN_335291 [Trichonephila inaurata madagascariensis]|uniref:Uncharacterized protein n=1 Tax=Trichonephila inaurata madagascariensis TaxID=2747483 RepID=A0A8X6I928_9ARAC|nr:hypothetical protein TNIN_335291 [Trichonephila inaurata madagascariensis]